MLALNVKTKEIPHSPLRGCYQRHQGGDTSQLSDPDDKNYD